MGMAAVTVEEMRMIEQVAFRKGISAKDLMETAGVALGKALGCQYPEGGTVVGYLGKGHNAGDALIALRVLRDRFGWEVQVKTAYPVEEWADLTRLQWNVLEIGERMDGSFSGSVAGTLLLLDGLLGIGAKGALRGPLAELAREMNLLRTTRKATVVAVDLPSGIDPDSGEIFPGAVTADRTFMIGAAKRGLLLGRAVNATGTLSLVEVEGLAGGEGDMELISPQTMAFGKVPRAFDFHKGKAGRVGVVAGSHEFSGAALLCVLGAIRAGGGLVTLYGRSETLEAVRDRLPFEAMLKICDDPREILGERLDAIVVGPGLGGMSADFSDGLIELIRKTEVPMLIDADGLNLISKHGTRTDARHVLTPHPGEFGRLFPDREGETRELAMRDYVSGCESVLLLKGARTIVAKHGMPLRINSTGTPAMSNGGQGDLLSGVIAALLAGGMEGFDAASLGAWLCGHAAELSVSENGEVCTATDTADYLGLALRAWRRGSR